MARSNNAPTADEPTKTVQSKALPVNAHHVQLRVSSIASPDTQVDEKTGHLLQPGNAITGPQLTDWIERIYLNQGWSVLNVIPRPLEGTTIPVLVLVSTAPQARKQIGFRLIIRANLTPANVLEADEAMVNLIKEGYEWQADKSKCIEGGGGTNVLHYFIKYAD